MGTIRDEARQPPTIPPFPPPTDVESRRVPPVGQQEKVDVDSRNVETERLCNNSHHQDSSICNRDEEDNSAQSQPLLEHIIQQGSRPMQSDLPLDFVGNPFLDDEQLEKAMKSSKQQQFWNYANRNRRQYERVQTVADEEIDVEMQCYPRRYKKVRFSAGSNCILHPDMRYPLYSESDLIKITENEEALSNIRNSARSATKNLMQSMRANKELTAYDDGEELQGEKKREAHRDRLLKKLQRMDNLMRQSGYGIEKVSIDSKDENAVIRFLLSRRG